MTRKQILVSGALLFGLVCTAALAGNVRLVSDTWDTICEVEVMSGTNAPNRGTTETFTNVTKGWSITKASRICFRRSRNPSHCDSGLTEWRCSSNPASGTDEFSLY